MPTFSIEELEEHSINALRRATATEREADIVGKHLVESDLVGHHSHGVMRIPQYAGEIERGEIKPGLDLKLVSDKETVAVYDGHFLFGQVSCYDAMRSAMDRARASGLGAVSLRRSNHSGRLGSYVTMAANEGMIGVVMHAGAQSAWVAPFGGMEGRLSTNPLAIGAPSGGEYPILLDMATCMAPEGKVRDHLNRGKQLPEGWVMDKDGHPSTDPQALYDGGAVLPLGGSAGHKGYVLSFMIQIISASIGGWTRDVLSVPARDVGHGTIFMLAIAVDRATTLETFQNSAREIATYVKSAKPAPGFEEVLAPGEWEHKQAERQRRDGIEVPDTVWAEIEAVGR